MPRHDDESLFEETKMTFGEHLEELRVCLTKAITGLVLGTLMGLLLAKQVVGVIQSPIEKALREHYSLLAVEELKEQYVGEISPELEEFVGKWALVFEEIYIENAQLERIAKGLENEGKLEESSMTPQEVIKQELAAPNAEYTKTRVWRTAEAQLTVLSVHEGFMIWLKAGFVFGIIVASPYIFLQLWLFVAAGLYPHERKYVYVYLPFSLALFLLGAATAFFFVFGPVLNFLFGFARMLDIAPDLRISEVISFVLFLPLGFGVAFQLPLVMLFLHRVGIFTVEMYLQKWRIAVLVIFVISMMLTPADPYSMLLMAGPLTALYFLGVALCNWMPRNQNPFDDEMYEPLRVGRVAAQQHRLRPHGLGADRSWMRLRRLSTEIFVRLRGHPMGMWHLRSLDPTGDTKPPTANGDHAEANHPDLRRDPKREEDARCHP